MWRGRNMKRDSHIWSLVLKQVKLSIAATLQLPQLDSMQQLQPSLQSRLAPCCHQSTPPILLPVQRQAMVSPPLHITSLQQPRIPVSLLAMSQCTPVCIIMNNSRQQTNLQPPAQPLLLTTHLIVTITPATTGEANLQVTVLVALKSLILIQVFSFSHGYSPRSIPRSDVTKSDIRILRVRWLQIYWNMFLAECGQLLQRHPGTSPCQGEARGRGRVSHGVVRLRCETHGPLWGVSSPLPLPRCPGASSDGQSTRQEGEGGQCAQTTPGQCLWYLLRREKWNYVFYHSYWPSQPTLHILSNHVWVISCIKHCIDC